MCDTENFFLIFLLTLENLTLTKDKEKVPTLSCNCYQLFLKLQSYHLKISSNYFFTKYKQTNNGIKDK